MKYFSMFSGIGGFEYAIQEVIPKLKYRWLKARSTTQSQLKRGGMNV